MTDKELRKLSRAELLEMLIIQTKEVERLGKELEEANHKLEDRRILLEKAGSIAEASLMLNDVFEAAQRAADQYLDNIRQFDAYHTERICDDREDEESDIPAIE
ncbi:MAG: DNA repair protein [Acutalibacteraceae bacterium]|nr:DNA repair protein [Acutalibacteraceae bacterium]